VIEDQNLKLKNYTSTGTFPNNFAYALAKMKVLKMITLGQIEWSSISLYNLNAFPNKALQIEQQDKNVSRTM
jgi:hypothetical protein